jgi:ArsR family transcriptional regulator, arsenate/arsenite/antimonite-responsive transcriptional repressor
MPKLKQPELSDDQVQLIAKALADPRRYMILKRLTGRDNAMPCSDVLDCAGISPATLSHHMKELEMAGLIQPVRKGKFVSYLTRREVLNAYLKKIKADLF